MGLRRAKETERASKFDRIMLDSGSQSTACTPNFADYDVEDTEKAKLRDIQDQPIESCGKNFFDVEFMGDDKQEDIPCSLSMDVSDVGKDVVSMGRMLQAGFDIHFIENGHKFWMVHKGRLSKIEEDDPHSVAPPFYLKMNVQPSPENGGFGPARCPAEQGG